MVAGTAAEIGIAGTAGAAISSLWRGAAACNVHRKGRGAVLMIKLMETREIAPYVLVHPDDDDRSDCSMCGHHDYFGGLCPPSSHFTASDFTGSDNTEVIKMCSHLLHSNVRRS